jgi:hypothetical protein
VIRFAQIVNVINWPKSKIRLAPLDGIRFKGITVRGIMVKGIMVRGITVKGDHSAKWDQTDPH